MAIFDPSDPLSWKQIKAEQDAQAAGMLGSGGTRYVTPGFGDDPEWLAYETTFNYGRTQAQADAELRKRQARDAYEQALRSLEQQGVQGARQTDTSLLARGMFNSGERPVRQEDMRRALGQGRSQADTQYTQQIGSVDSDLNRALTQLDMERERQIVASKARIAETQRQGAIEAGTYSGAAGAGGGGGGGSTSSATSTVPQRTPSQQQSTLNQQRAVDYSQTYQNPGAGRGAYGPVAAKPVAPRPAAVSTTRPGAGRGSTGALAAKPKPQPRALPKVVNY